MGPLPISKLNLSNFVMSSFCLKFISHDLDNILLENLGETRTLQAVFELEALVLTGILSEDRLSTLVLGLFSTILVEQNWKFLF